MKTKLVRDRCPAVLEGECEPASTEAEYHMALVLKMHEEVQEIAGSPTDPEEYADLLETMLALGESQGVDVNQILDALETKRALLGRFRDGQILDGTAGGPGFTLARQQIEAKKQGALLSLQKAQWWPC